MFKILTTCMLTALLSLTHVTTSIAADKKVAVNPANDIRFQRPLIIGIVAFNKENYAKAIKKFQRALKVAPGNKGALTYLMFAGFKSKNGQVTAQAGDQLIAAGDDSSRTLFITAKGHRLAKNENQAREYFGRIAERDDDPYQTSAELALADTGLSYRPKGFRGSLILAYERDTNISSTPNDAANVGASDTKDFRWVVTASVQYNHRVGERFYVGATGLLLDQFYNKSEAHNFEVDLARAGVHAGMVGYGWDAKVAIERELVGFGHDEFITTNRAILTYNHQVMKNYRISLVARVADDTFEQNSTQNATKLDLEFNNRILLPFVAAGASLSLNYRHRDNKTDNTSTFSYDSNQYRISFFTPLPWFSTYIDISYSKEDRDYDEPNPTERNDEYRETSLKIGKVWSRNLRNEIYYRYYDADSSLNSFVYDRETTGINLIYSF